MKEQARRLESTMKYRKTLKGLLTNIYDKQKQRSKKRNHPDPDYSLKDFHEMFLKDKRVCKIYNNWVNSGYKYYEILSFDRINNKLPYTIDNIKPTTWKENRAKGDKENSQVTTEVIQKDVNGNIIKTYKSIKEAANKTNLNQSLISLCCLKLRNHTGGYKFEYGSYKRKSSATFTRRKNDIHSGITCKSSGSP